MRILTRYIITSIMRTAFVTILIFALLLAAVELFSKMDSIMHSEVPLHLLVEYTVLSIPEYMLMAASISLLFAVTYFLSSLSANNELIPLLNAGISPLRLRLPVMVLAIILTFLGSLFQEHAVIAAAGRHDELETELFGSSSTRDTRNIVLSDEDGFLIYTRRFSEATGEIRDPVLVQTDGDRIIRRVQASRARFEEDPGYWVFTDATVYTIDDSSITAESCSTYSDPLFDLDPRLFRSQNTAIETMDRDTALDYLERLWESDRATWQEKATDYYRRVASPLAILTLMFIAVSMNYNFKKNVLLFSVIQSLSIAVIYYVADMVFSIMGHQGAASPLAAVLFPIVLTVLLSLVISLLGRKI